MRLFFLITGGVGVCTFIVSSILIHEYLKKAGEKANFLLLRMLMISNASKYRKLTREKTGKTGPLFTVWIVSVNLALACFLIIAFFYSR